ncbi:MAG: response regulator [Deltaproteobacteria bacterium]|nr:response regulator [Deltaproteobacteria bacterium]
MIKKILIVDDSPISIKIIKSCIPKDQNYELFDAADGQIGVEKYKEVKPDLTFMDLTMPVMNGFQALEEIIKFDHKAMVIILTADVQIKAVAKAHELGAFSVLKKPPAKESIAAAIKEADVALSERG